MNGIISRKAIRFTLVASVCLLTGFASGANYHGVNLLDLLPKKEINFSKIGWVSSTFETKNISLAQMNSTEADFENQAIRLAEFHLPARSEQRLVGKE